jgi:hypothetical protein
MTRTQAIIVIVLAMLLGMAGWLWFDEWYGALTAVGAGAVRVGSTFVWRLWWRYLRRRILREMYKIFIPTFIKRPLNASTAYLRRRISYHSAPLVRMWKRSVLLRAVMLGPIVILLAVAAYYATGIWEFLLLTPIPFLVAEILPESFWVYLLSALTYYVVLLGLESTVMRIAALFPPRIRAKISVWRYRLSNQMARLRRQNRLWQAMHKWNKDRRNGGS